MLIELILNLGLPKIKHNGQVLGRTPQSIRVKRSLGGAPSYQIEKLGYQKAFLTPSKSFNPVSILSVFFGIIGVGVDLATGGVVKYDPLVYNLELDPKS